MTATVPGTFTPRPGGASLPRMVVAQGLLEAKLLLRNGEQLLLALVIPLLLLVAGVLAPGIDLGDARKIDVLAPGVMALAVMSTSFTGLAIATAFERRYGVIKRLGVSPLPRVGLLAGKTLAVLLVECLQLLVLSAAAFALGWHPQGGLGAVGGAAVLVLAGTAAFSSLGLLMAGLLRAEATLAAANLCYLLLLLAGATVVPIAEYPSTLQAVVSWVPSGALAEGLRGLFTGAATAASVAGSAGVLLLWALVGGIVTGRTFKWE